MKIREIANYEWSLKPNGKQKKNWLLVEANGGRLNIEARRNMKVLNEHSTLIWFKFMPAILKLKPRLNSSTTDQRIATQRCLIGVTIVGILIAVSVKL